MESVENNEIIIFEDKNGEINLEVSLTGETVWLNQKQIEVLFERDQSGISRHLKNIFKDGELDKNCNMQKMHIANSDKPVEFYNLDVIISLGYRVNSKRATSFRIWATKVLKEHLIKGYSINQKRIRQKGLDELDKTIALLKNTIEKSELELTEAKGLLDVIINYSRTWTLLQGYDEDSLKKEAEKKEEKFILDFDEVKGAKQTCDR